MKEVKLFLELRVICPYCDENMKASETDKKGGQVYCSNCLKPFIIVLNK